MSSDLPPILANVVEKIRSGTQMELKELLPCNVALLQQIHEDDANLVYLTSGYPLIPGISLVSRAGPGMMIPLSISALYYRHHQRTL